MQFITFQVQALIVPGGFNVGLIGTTCTALPVNTQVAASYMAIPPAPIFPLSGGPFNSVPGLVSKTWYRMRIPFAFDQCQSELSILKSHQPTRRKSDRVAILSAVLVQIASVQGAELLFSRVSAL